MKIVDYSSEVRSHYNTIEALNNAGLLAPELSFEVLKMEIATKIYYGRKISANVSKFEAVLNFLLEIGLVFFPSGKYRALKFIHLGRIWKIGKSVIKLLQNIIRRKKDQDLTHLNTSP